jgi:hypothetical protein
MTVAADHQGFAALRLHDLHPRGRWLPGPVEVGELADVVDLDGVRLSAQFAAASPEPLGQLLGRVDGTGRGAVGKDRPFVPLGGNTPNRATSGLLPSRWTRASKQVRGPCGVRILALKRAAIFATDERCLQARVLSIHRRPADPVAEGQDPCPHPQVIAAGPQGRADQAQPDHAREHGCEVRSGRPGRAPFRCQHPHATLPVRVRRVDKAEPGSQEPGWLLRSGSSGSNHARANATSARGTR